MTRTEAAEGRRPLSARLGGCNQAGAHLTAEAKDFLRACRTLGKFLFGQGRPTVDQTYRDGASRGMRHRRAVARQHAANTSAAVLSCVRKSGAAVVVALCPTRTTRDGSLILLASNVEVSLLTRLDIVDRLWGGKDVFIDVETGVNTVISKCARSCAIH